MKETDTLRRFVFERAPVRGILVHLDATWQAILAKRDYPPIVQKQLGQLLAAGALLSSTIKLKGSMTMQVQGNGPISMMVVEATSDRTFRALAKYKDDIQDGDLGYLFGDARLVITIDSEYSKDRYQGIVLLEGKQIADSIEHYLHNSEQLETRLWLAMDGKQATGMLVQKLPDEPDQDPDAWNRIVQLASTIHKQELTNLSAEEILNRLFHEETLRLFEAEPLSFRCSCSRDRVRDMLRTLGIDEVHSIIKDEGVVDVACEFCGQQYVFDKVDAEVIFAADVEPPAPPTKH